MIRKAMLATVLAAALAFPALADAPERTERDPFIPPTLGTVTFQVDDKNGPTEKDHEVKKNDQLKETPLAPPPQVEANLNGIVYSAKGAQAIITSEGQTFMVSRGDQLGAWTVSAVRPDGVDLTLDETTVRLEMADQFGLR